MLQTFSAAEFLAALRQIGYKHRFNQGPSVIPAHEQRRTQAVPNVAEPDRTVTQILVRATGLTEDRILELLERNRLARWGQLPNYRIPGLRCSAGQPLEGE